MLPDKMACKYIVISLGGSLLYPKEGIDADFLQAFKRLIENRVAKKEKFIIIVGGGKICRNYQAAGKALADLTNLDLDWIGIHVTRLNAHFVRIIFGELTHHEIITDPRVIKDVVRPIAVGAGWKPGFSTDFDTVDMAREAGAKKLVNLSNIDYVYSDDPKVNTEARPIKKISWKEYRALIPKEWKSGLNTPFDPIASKEAEKLGLEVAIMNGDNLENLNRYLDGKSFEGTVIS
jgi:uridylate kinase